MADPRRGPGRPGEPEHQGGVPLPAPDVRRARVEYVVIDYREGPGKPVREVLPQATWQRCHVHFQRNARDCLREPHCQYAQHSQLRQGRNGIPGNGANQ